MSEWNKAADFVLIGFDSSVGSVAFGRRVGSLSVLDGMLLYTSIQASENSVVA